MKLAPVILAGGGGTRLWPLSRAHYPKQFIRLFGNDTLLQGALARLDKPMGGLAVLDPLIICNEAHRFLVAEQSAGRGRVVSQIILEPEGRNTAPALTLAALTLAAQYEDAVIVMMPADHLIKDLDAFHAAIQAGHALALKDYLVTFGVTPARAETGYGYIHAGRPIDQTGGTGACQVNEFTEKPDPARAERYLAAGDYYWNSGIFMLKATAWLAQIGACHPRILSACEQAYAGGQQDGLFYRLGEQAFLSCPSDSIDYAVMEKLATKGDARLAVIPTTMGWSDIGAWPSVWAQKDKDAAGNVIEGDVLAIDSADCLIKSERGLIAALGCANLIIVDSDDALVIADKGRAEDIKRLVAHLKDRKESLMHRKVYRPWGHYDSVDQGANFQVKRLTVNPGKKLSLQLHHKRAEHWVVVRGVATVTRGAEVFELKENESTYIPVGMKHRLENATGDLLELIEVQSGAYLGEDDIVRFADDFGRN